jgi:hypothetical protein
VYSVVLNRKGEDGNKKDKEKKEKKLKEEIRVLKKLFGSGPLGGYRERKEEKTKEKRKRKEKIRV